LPSVFFRLAASALEGRRLTVEDIDRLPAEALRRLSAGALGASDPSRALTVAERDIALLETTPDLGRAVLHRLSPMAARADALRRARWGSTTLTAYDGQVASDEARAALEKWLQESRPFSPSALETYAACPFRFFLESVLRVGPLDEPEAIIELDALTRGSVIHAVLERFLSGLAARALLTQPADELRAQLLAIAEEELDVVAARGLGGAPLLWGRARQEILDDLLRWLDLERERPTPFTHSAFEVAFGGLWAGKEESPLSREDPLELTLEGRTVTFRGRIDRVDWNDDGAFQVVDYKSGRNRAHGLLQGGKALQLALYLHAAARILEFDPARGRASYEFLTRRGGFTSHVVEGSELLASEASIEDVLGRIVEGALAGDFHHQPGECRFCDFDAVCDGGRARIAERKATDPRRVSFAEMREIP
jgi:RecB family exonuclease